MINRNLLTVSDEGVFEFETLEYLYPESNVKLRYNVGNGDKVHYLRVGYKKSGHLVYRSKHEVAAKAQAWLDYEFRITNGERS